MTDLAGGTLEARIEYAARRKKEMNCCQAVLVAFADFRSTCGALVGAIMVSSLLSPDGEARNNSRTIMSRFKERCGGATICRDLKGIGTGKVLCSCEDCVRNAVLAAGEALKIK